MVHENDKSAGKALWKKGANDIINFGEIELSKVVKFVLSAIPLARRFKKQAPATSLQHNKNHVVFAIHITEKKTHLIFTSAKLRVSSPREVSRRLGILLGVFSWQWAFESFWHLQFVVVLSKGCSPVNYFIASVLLLVSAESAIHWSPADLARREITGGVFPVTVLCLKAMKFKSNALDLSFRCRDRGYPEFILHCSEDRVRQHGWIWESLADESNP